MEKVLLINMESWQSGGGLTAANGALKANEIKDRISFYRDLFVFWVDMKKKLFNLKKICAEKKVLVNVDYSWNWKRKF